MNKQTAARTILASSLLFLGVACGPPEDPDPDGGTPADTGDESDAPADAGGMDAGDDGTDDAGDDEPEDTGADETGTEDTGSDASTDAGDDATDTGEGGTPEGPALVASTTSDSTSQIYVALDRTSGEFDDSLTRETGTLLLDESNGKVFGLDQQCAGQPEDCPVSAGSAIDTTVSETGTPSVARTLDLPDGVYNPKGVGFAGAADRTFVSAMGETELYQYDGSGNRTDPLDIGQFNTGSSTDDGSPEATDLAVEGDFVLVTLLRLTNFQPDVNSAVAVYDTTEETFVDQDDGTESVAALDLGGTNAKAGLAEAPDGSWAVAFTGENPIGDTTLDGEIARFELDDSGQASVGETLVTEETLGGDIQTYVMLGAETGVAEVKASGRNFVHFDASGSEVQTTNLTSHSGFQTALCRTPDASEVWVGGPTESGGEFRGYDTGDLSELDAPAIEADSGQPSGCTLLPTAE